MACHLLAPSHYLKKYWHFVNWNLWNKINWNIIFIQVNTFENVVCKIVAILSRSHCVKLQYTIRSAWPMAKNCRPLKYIPMKSDLTHQLVHWKLDPMDLSKYSKFLIRSCIWITKQQLSERMGFLTPGRPQHDFSTEDTVTRYWIARGNLIEV